MRLTLLLAGLACLLVGGLWIGQGTGIILWPDISPMLNVRIWAWYGAGLALVGVALIVWSRRG